MMTSRARTIITALLFLVLGSRAAPPARAQQSSPSSDLTFDAASVKQNLSVKEIPSLSVSPEGISYTWVTLRDCIQEAYGIQQHQVVGPDWLPTARYDIKANAGRVVARAEMRVMFQNLLRERFKLAAHPERRQIPVYALVAGKHPSIKPSNTNAANDTQMSAGGFAFKNKSMKEFADFLSSWQSLGRSVVDMTGLEGTYDFTFTWFENPTGGNSGEAFGALKRSMATADPSLFMDAVDRLGLKLEARKAETDVLVIDHIERVPVQN